MSCIKSYVCVICYTAIENILFFTCIITSTSDLYLLCELGLHMVLFFQLEGLLSVLLVRQV